MHRRVMGDEHSIEVLNRRVDGMHSVWLGGGVLVAGTRGSFRGLGGMDFRLSDSTTLVGVEVSAGTRFYGTGRPVGVDLGIEVGPVRLKCALLSLKVLKAGVYGIESLEQDLA